MPEIFRFSPLLIVTAVAAEIQDVFGQWSALPIAQLPIGQLVLVNPQVVVLVTGVGAVRAAAATALALSRQPFAALLHAGVGGAYPHTQLAVGDVAVALSECDPQAGIILPDGYQDLGGLGFPLTDDIPNRLWFDSSWADWVARHAAPAPRLPFATVQCCSGTDADAATMARRTAADVENMEGLAVAWTTQQFGVPYAAIRAISNFTGDRARQQWNFPAARAALAQRVRAILNALYAESDQDYS